MKQADQDLLIYLNLYLPILKGNKLQQRIKKKEWIKKNGRIKKNEQIKKS